MAGESERQRSIDSFYWSNGPCCAGCDWWRSYNAAAGECLKSCPMSGVERAGMLGIRNATVTIPAGHAITMRGHHCGDFKDDFDWSSLPLGYRKQVGAPANVSRRS